MFQLKIAKSLRAPCLFSALLLLSPSTQAADATVTGPSLLSALSTGTVNGDFRLRWETADSELPSQPEDANAVTLRSRLGYTSSAWRGFDLNIEFEQISATSDRAYNSTVNGVTTRAVVPDPIGTDLNQFWLRYSGFTKSSAQIGRNRLNFDNARWLGTVAWRQNEQTYDSILLKSTAISGVDATYAFITNTNSIFGTNFPMVGHVLNVGWTVNPSLKLVPYLYQFDFKENLAARYDTRSIGLRATGSYPVLPSTKLTYTAEFARQTGIDAAPSFVEADYLLAELGLAHKRLQGKLGYEVLGSKDGRYGLQTPLSTLHAHNGWADLFLNTPKAGLVDRFLTLTSTLQNTALQLAVHRFDSDTGNNNYGRELNFSANYPLNKQVGLGFKYARYKASELRAPTAANANARLSDNERLWLQTEFKF